MCSQIKLPVCMNTLCRPEIWLFNFKPCTCRNELLNCVCSTIWIEQNGWTNSTVHTSKTVCTQALNPGCVLGNSSYDLRPQSYCNVRFIIKELCSPKLCIYYYVFGWKRDNSNNALSSLITYILIYCFTDNLMNMLLFSLRNRIMYVHVGLTRTMTSFKKRDFSYAHAQWNS